MLGLFTFNIVYKKVKDFIIFYLLFYSWKMLALRIFTNLNVLWLLASSVYAVVVVVDRSTKQRETGGWWRQNEVTIVVSLITNLFPFIFEMLGSLEQYHPRKRLRMQLARYFIFNG